MTNEPSNHQKDTETDNFLHPTSQYYGDFTPQNLVFNANLQEFGQKVSYLCDLETNGKITSEETYNQIKLLWEKLRDSHKEIFGNKD